MSFFLLSSVFRSNVDTDIPETVAPQKPISLILSILLVAEIPMFSLKFKSLKWRENITVYSFIIFGLFTAVIFVIFSFVWSGWVALIFISYIIFNLLNSIICRKI